ncbi:MAG: DUF3806 domain-containing protein [Pseudomonadota bacterium]
MKSARPRAAFLGLALVPVLCLGSAAWAQVIETSVSPLTALDRQYMDQQRQSVAELTLRYYGGRCCRREAELSYLQRLLDDSHVRDDDRELLQAMGIAMGDLLADELDLRWVIYEDAEGRSRALQLNQTENFLFPVTMISRRREGGDRTPVAEVYQQAVEAMQAAKPPLPFQ